MSEIKKLAVVGASCRAVATSGLRAGYEVAAADLFADADLQRLCAATRINGYPEALADWLDSVDCDGWLYTGALENHPELISRMAKLRPLLGNGGGPLRAVRNPLLLQDVLRGAGLSFPETVAEASQRLPLDRSWLCKTYRGASGSGVWLLDGPAALERAERERAVFQRFVDGVSASAVWACSSQGGQLLGVTRQLVGDAKAGAKPWHYSGSVGPLDISDEARSQLVQLGELLSGRFHLRGLVGVDLVISKNRAWVLEVNPRYSASVEIIERVTGVSAVAAHVAACQGSKYPLTDASGANKLLHGKVVVYAKRPVAITTEFFDWAIEQSSSVADDGRLGDIPHAHENLEAGQPVLTVFVAASPKEFDGELNARITAVESRLYATA
jgi:predicted ATP-grasp superfamily ATP-dependent carboligase